MISLELKSLNKTQRRKYAVVAGIVGALPVALQARGLADNRIAMQIGSLNDMIQNQRKIEHSAMQINTKPNNVNA